MKFSNTLFISFTTIILVSTCLSVVSSQTANCLQTPWDPSCATYQYPLANITADIEGLCTSMSFMPVCTIDKVCQDNDLTDGVCTPFSVLADGCQYDMPMMSNCKNYRTLCVANTTVPSCTNDQSIKNLGDSKTLGNLIISICTEMNMDACSQCPVSTTPTGNQLKCDVLTTYSQLCQSMPNMQQCSQWHDMCMTGSQLDQSPLSSIFCTPPANKQIPLMRMFFHTGILDYILFEDWVPRTNKQYAGYWFLIFFFAIIFECEKTLRSMLERRWEAVRQRNMEINGEELIQNSLIKGSFPPFDYKVDILRGFLHGFELTLSYLLMLVAMTFNVALFFAVIAGTIFGNILVGRFRGYKPKVTCCD
ncbi:hypothetical protein PPL_02342 [Heterostelium album PN500]|uniref:Copper transport protein n=1 Tax=Heterostelium pallidum (strain ATCC 26659 / Pp 5 / PN500) TaxID=670386 RepID=D3B215_HETP5|nr:hypothetical protein PPL_02342 [Heterostelium album PN500]EFA85339.1 hypothetical protein PPL_02342 [Heterostelium album PN500]|eukprot:XP_020437448.1 hypothetical protein PPL_02342 [Heterostelium album PN500]